jgi:hypothetical protein
VACCWNNRWMNHIFSPTTFNSLSNSFSQTVDPALKECKLHANQDIPYTVPYLRAAYTPQRLQGRKCKRSLTFFPPEDRPLHSMEPPSPPWLSSMAPAWRIETEWEKACHLLSTWGGKGLDTGLPMLSQRRFWCLFTGIRQGRLPDSGLSIGRMVNGRKTGHNPEEDGNLNIW